MKNPEKSLRTLTAGLLLATILFVPLHVAGEEASGEGPQVMFGPTGPVPYHIPGYGIEHTKPHPYLMAQLDEKLMDIQSEVSDTGLQLHATQIVLSNFPENYKPPMRSTGDNNLLVILVDFSDAPHGPNQTREEVLAGFNGPGTAGSIPPHDSVKGFYERSSYGLLNFTADGYGWYRASHDREYYEQLPYGEGWRELAKECLDAFDDEIDYSRYDNDNDEDIDTLYLIWTGSDFNQFWWGYFMGGIATEEWDGLVLESIIFSPYTWGGSDQPFSPGTINHETGHLLGLPDYYDYSPSTGPCGGLGGFDEMDGGAIDHNCFSKYLLGWIDPLVIRDGEHDVILRASSEYPDAVIMMPHNSDGPYSEFFMAQTRNPASGNDNSHVWWNWPGKPEWTSQGLAVWHVDATLSEWGDFKYDNSYSPYKLLRLMEADGLEELAQSCYIANNWDPGDLYYPGQEFGPHTTPNSNRYDGSSTGITIDNIVQEGSGMGMRISIDSQNQTTDPPASVTNLHTTSINTMDITWVWTNPADVKFSGVMIYLNDIFMQNVTKAIQTYHAEGLSPDTEYTLSTHAFNAQGVVNQTWVNSTARTKATAPTTTPTTIIPTITPTTAIPTSTPTTTPVIQPPVAAFTADPDSGYAPLTVQFTDSSLNNVISWNWNFGDGSTSTQQNPVHTFDEVGTYTVTLTVQNDCGSDSTAAPINAICLEPVAAFTADPNSGYAPLRVQFTDSSENNVDTWLWNFGDGTTSEEQNPEHTFDEAGTYTVKLTAYNDCGFDSTTAPINAICLEPVAQFTANPTSGYAPLTVQFTDNSQNNVDTWLWNFGDGTTSEEQNPEHTFDEAGTYTVKLTAYNDCGFDSTTAPINAICLEPVADFTANPTSGRAPLTVQFTDLSTYNPDTWLWEFGDDNTSSSQHPVHTYTTAGTYSVTLQVTNSAGSDTKTRVDYIHCVLVVQPFPNPSGGYFPPPTDMDEDGTYEELDGNGWIGFNDVVVFYNNLDAIDNGLHGSVTLFDYDGNGWAGFNDVVLLYEMIE